MAQWTRLPKYVHTIVADTPQSVLLQTSRFDNANRASYLFLDPVEVVTAATLDDLPNMFAQIEAALRQGLYVAGFISYECGYHFERFDQAVLIPQSMPLAWFGIYSQPFIFDHAKGCFENETPTHPLTNAGETKHSRITDKISLALSPDDYRSKILRIKELIAAGDTYQVNFTDRVSFQTSIPPAAAFDLLSQHQHVSYGAFIHTDDRYVLSLSPELFFRTERGHIITRPMKGTMARGLDADEDVLASLQLQGDEKNRSEHLMIVDLIRNDLGRLCKMGSVRVEDIFSVERYETLLQMTSTISGELQPGLTYYDIFQHMFPSGSITGAPKIRTMQIIGELEDTPRGLYTGAIGFISPAGSSVFNVAIRTLVLKEGSAEMGVGGGIVADSTASEEYAECLLKAAFLTREHNDFQLIETLLWEESFYLLSMHIDRLRSSAFYFGFAFDDATIRSKLEEATKLFMHHVLYRVRLLIDSSGEVTITCSQLASSQAFRRVRLAHETTCSRDVFLRHKTTRRELYEQQYASALADGFDEIIFTNERGEVTEGAISNIFVRHGDKLLTPPIASGVLPGIFRRHLLETLDNAAERILTVGDLEAADEVFLCNSVRGIQKIQILELGLASSAAPT